MSNFVVVHGAWAGAWGWDRVAARLRAKGHQVHVPTLSGLGERSHLAHLPITLSTHVDDIVNEVLWHDLEDIVLVAHSYGGIVGTMVAERIGERISALVYLEGFIAEDGQSFEDIAEATFEGPTVPAQPSGPGDYLSEADVAWSNAKATPQPTGTFKEKARVTGRYRDIGRKTFIVATGWDGPFGQIAAPFRDDPAWTVHDLPCGHDVPMDLPDELTALLEQA